MILARIATAPVFPDDDDKTRRAALLHRVVLTLLLAISIFAPLAQLSENATWQTTMATFGVVALFHVLVLVILALRHVWMAITVYVGMYFLQLTIVVFFFGGIRESPAGGFATVVLVSGLLVGRRATLFIGLAALAVISVAAVLDSAGNLPTPLITMGLAEDWITLATLLCFSGLFLNIALSELENAFARIRALVVRAEDAAHETRQARDAESRRAEQAETLATLATGALDDRLQELVVKTAHACRQVAGARAVMIYILDESGSPAQASVGLDASEEAALLARGFKGSDEHITPIIISGRTNGFLAVLPKDTVLLKDTTSTIPKDTASTNARDAHLATVSRDVAATDNAVQQFIQATASMLGGASLRHRAENQLRHAQKMDLVGRLAGGVAHDFNNLLTSIGGCAALLEEELSEEDPNKGLVNDIRAASDRATLLTRRLLSFSRRQTPIRTRFLLDDAIQSFLPVLRRVIDERVTIVVELNAPDVVIEGDPTQLEQVVLNLVVNARDAMPNGGNVHVSTAVELGSHDDRDPSASMRNYVSVTVKDDGTGISDDTKQRLFEPFFTTKQDGTGLGLATVRGIADDLGGDVFLESVLGAGASFSLLLPFTDAPASKPTTPLSTTKTTDTSLHVLFVDDDRGVRITVRRMLQKLGHRVTLTGSAEAALTVLAERSDIFHVVVSDVVLGGMSGRELKTRINTSWPSLPVLLASGYAPDSDAPADHVDVRKPFTMRELGAHLERVTSTTRTDNAALVP